MWQAFLLGILALSAWMNPRYVSYKDPAVPHRLTALADNADLGAFLQKPRPLKPRVWIEPGTFPFDFGLWWGIVTVTDPAQATHRLARAPAAEYTQLTFAGTSGLNLYIKRIQ